MSETASEIEVRPARHEDAPALARIYVDAWRATYAGILPNRALVELSTDRQTHVWARTLSRRGRGEDIVLVAESRAAGVVGFGSGGPAAAGPDGWGEVYTLYVHPDHHEAGIGSALLARLFRELAGRGFESALVWVLARNPFRFFYEAMGGRRFAERSELLWGRRIAEVGYAWEDLGEAAAHTRAARD